MSTPLSSSTGFSLPAEHSGRVGLRLDPVRGRCLLAVRNFQAQEVIIHEPSHAFSLTPAALERSCQACLLDLPTQRKRCAACRIARYCSAECQRFHWPLHKLECASLRHFFGVVTDVNESDTARLLLIPRILLAHRCIEAQTAAGRPLPPILEEMRLSMPLVRSLSTAGEPTGDQTQPLPAAVKQTFADHCVFYMTGRPCRASDAERAEVLQWDRRLATNCMDMAGRARSLGAVVCLANHDCEPNAMQLPAGRIHTLAASRPIAAGDKITISSLDEQQLSASVLDRRRYLLAVYKFLCTCRRCESESQQQRSRKGGD